MAWALCALTCAHPGAHSDAHGAPLVIRWEGDRVSVGPWRVDLDAGSFTLQRDPRQVVHATVAGGADAGPAPAGAVPDAANARYAWIAGERLCLLDRTRAVRRCATIPPEPARRSPRLQAALDRARQVEWLTGNTGQPSCARWSVTSVERGWRLMRVEGDTTTSYDLRLDGEDLALAGPTLTRRLPDGTTRGEARGCFHTLRVSSVTDERIVVNGGQWYLAPQACEQARRLGCGADRCFTPSCP